MLHPETYAVLHAALVRKNVTLINDSVACRHAHVVSESYPVIEAFTPGTT